MVRVPLGQGSNYEGVFCALSTRGLPRGLDCHRIPASRITVDCLHPVIVDTDARQAYRAAMVASGGKLSGREPVDGRTGAECSLYLATADEVRSLSGKYFVDCCQVEPLKEAQDSEAARRLWVISDSLSRLDDAIN